MVVYSGISVALAYGGIEGCGWCEVIEDCRGWVCYNEEDREKKDSFVVVISHKIFILFEILTKQTIISILTNSN